MVREVIDRVLMDLTGKYQTLEDFAQRLEDRLKFEGLGELSVGIDERLPIVAVLYKEKPMVSIFFSRVPEDPQGEFHFRHEEFCEHPDPVIWDMDVLREFQMGGSS